MTSEDNSSYDQEHITEERSFDQLAKGLSNGTLSRGKALKLLGAALVGGTLASLGIGEAAAARPRCKRDGMACKKNNQCCSGRCENRKCAPACASGGAACTTDTDCCSGYGCDSSGMCRAIVPCGEAGALCTTDTDCCSGYGCDSSGMCRAIVPCAGADCTTDADCCSGYGCDSSGLCRATQAQTA